MNFKITQDGDKYKAIVTDKSKYETGAVFCGEGSSWPEAIGACLMANREALGMTFEIHEEGKLPVYSTEYGRPRKIEE